MPSATQEHPERALQRPGYAPAGPAVSPGFLLWRATLRWQRSVAAALRPHDLTHVQFVALASAWWLEEHPEPPTQRQLADHAAIDPMMTSQVLRTLETKKLIGRTSDPSDTRAKRVHLTRAGHARIAAALPAVERVDQAFFETVPQATLAPVLQALAGIAEPRTPTPRAPATHAGG